MSMTGEEHGPPVRVAASIIDLTTGMWVALGIQAALARRAGTGLAQDVDASLIDSGYTLLCHQVMGHLATGEVPQALGSASPYTAPYQAFEAADGRLMIAAGTDVQFARLCDVLHLGELVGEPRFRGPADRVEHRHELRALLEARLRSAPVTAWLERLDVAGVPAGPIQGLAEAVRHPIVAELGLLAEPEGNRRIDDLRLLRLPVDDGTSPMRQPPALGADTGAVLREAGLGDELIDRVTSRLQNSPGVR
jgi:crotonobetainyl-CoA:carnitine CoA-transferase CaiB-like acyl-CoA transferase